MTHSSLAIRIAGPEDVRGVVRVLAETNIATYAETGLTKEALEYHFNSPDWTLRKQEEFLGRMSAGGTIFVGSCACAEEVVAFSMDLRTWPGGGLAVRPDHQNTSLGPNLILRQFGGDYPEDNEFTVVPGTPMVKIYERLGLIPKGMADEDKWPVLRGSQELPQLELVATPNDRARITTYLGRLLNQRGILIPVDGLAGTTIATPPA